MKKQICGIICLVALVALSLFFYSCTGKEENAEELQKNQSLKKTVRNFTKQQKIEIVLPDKNFSNLISMDKDYYYFENNEADEWQYLRVDRSDTSRVVKFSHLEKGMDINLQHGHDGNLYIGAITWHEAKDDTFTGDYDRWSSPTQYKIIKLMPEGDMEEIFSCDSMGMPSIVPCGDKVAIEVNDGTDIDLKLLDLNTKKAKTIFHSSYKRDQNGLFNGTILMGMDYPHPTASPEGVCYQVCILKNEEIGSAKVGENHFYYYDVKTGDIKKMAGHYRPVEFVGGTDKAYIVSGYQMNQEEQFVRLYATNENGKYQGYVFEKKDMQYGIAGSVCLNDELLLAHDSYDGYYVIDLQKMTYSKSVYMTEDEKKQGLESENRSGDGEVTGFAYEKGCFAFSCSKGDKVIIYEITPA